MTPDGDLVRAMLEGDAAAFDELFARHTPAVRQRIVRIVRDPVAAEDLVQETFLRLWTRGRQWRAGASVEPWLARVATNLALNHLRSCRRRPSQPFEPAAAPGRDEDGCLSGRLVDDLSLGPDELCEQAERQQLLRNLVGTLPDAQREVMCLMLEQQMDVAEIASTLGVAPGTVKSRLYYARERLKEQLEEE